MVGDPPVTPELAPIPVPDTLQASPEPATAVPEDRISVISPQGEQGSVPSDWFFKEGVGKGYKLPAPTTVANGIPQPDDLTPDKGQVKVVDSKGQQGTLPLDWYLANGDKAKEYTLASQGGDQIAHQAKVSSILDTLSRKNPEEIAALGGEKKDVQTEKGDYKLVAPNGDKVNIPAEHLQDALSGGFKFQSGDFQALYDANIRLGAQEGFSKKSAEAGASGYVGSLPGFDYLRDELTNSTDAMFGKAQNIANRQLEQTTQATAHGVGTGLGVAAQMATGGVFGEGRLASAAGEGISALAPAGSSLGRQLAVRALSGAVEGAIISSPQALAQGILQKDPAGAAESLALGMGIGGLLGVGSKLVGMGLEKGASALQPAVADKALQGLGASEELLKGAGSAKQPFFKSLIEGGLTPASSPEKVE